MRNEEFNANSNSQVEFVIPHSSFSFFSRS
jgi:hypothetical protein